LVARGIAQGRVIRRSVMVPTMAVIDMIFDLEVVIFLYGFTSAIETKLQSASNVGDDFTSALGVPDC
jgi:hypothetical protein